MNVHELIERNRNGESIGLPSFCTANQHVLEATLGFAAENDLPVLIEATCNQVNQEGGYTGMKPADFASWVARLASHAGVNTDQLLLGGDHLGPNTWRDEPVRCAKPRRWYAAMSKRVFRRYI
jgi:D-tagatose-1,6-bisphosphate aldolase subunit GatZ/KbaZ